jgi:hypothetical protein
VTRRRDGRDEMRLSLETERGSGDHPWCGPVAAQASTLRTRNRCQRAFMPCPSTHSSASPVSDDVNHPEVEAIGRKRRLTARVGLSPSRWRWMGLPPGAS